MSLKYRPFAALGFTLLLSLFVILYFSYDLSVIFISAGALLLLITLLFKRFRERIVPLYVASAMIIAGISSYISCADNRMITSEFADKTVNVTGTVIGEPEYSNSRYYYVIDLDKIDDKSVDAKLRLSAPEEIGSEPFDTVSLNAKIYRIASQSREIQHYYYSKGIVIGAYALDNEESEIVITERKGHNFEYTIFRIQDRIVSNISDKLPNEAGATVVAMLLGDKTALSEVRAESFREAGVAPIFAVSGLHLSIWVMGLYSILSQFNVKKKINSAIGLTFTVVFMFLAGLSPSVCRAGLMMILLLSAGLFHRKSDSLNSLGFAAFILCLLNPFAAVDTGFLLSFTATLGIVTVVPIADRYIFSKIPENLAGAFVKSILTALTVGLSASISVLPVTILFIGRISVYSVISNLLLSPIATVCMVTGGFAAITYPVSFVSDCLALISGLCAKFMLAIIDFICSTSVTTFSADNLFWKAGALASVCVLIFSMLTFKGRNVLKSVCIGLAVVISVFGLTSYYYYNGLTQIHILNVGNGVSAVLSDNDGKIALTGEADDYLKPLKINEKLNRLSSYNPDLIVLADSDAAYDKANLSLLKSLTYNNVVLPEINGDVKTLVSADRLSESACSDIKVFDNDSIRVNIQKEYSVGVFNAGETTVLFLFDNYKNTRIPQDYLKADYLVCCGYIPDCISPEIYERVIICGNGNETESVYNYVIKSGGRPIFANKYDEIVINIREDTHKLILLEE